ncbi:MAG: hypothetical protein HY903_02235 [Deltaproteobacteria bacterium]|nr:hypothetical protein [Deltaproteobacteria bacterium]
MQADSDDTPVVATPTPGLILAPTPARLERERLRERVSAVKDEIAAIDLGVANLRRDLGGFEAMLEVRLWREHELELRLARVIGYLEAWGALLRQTPRAKVERRGRRLNRRQAAAARPSLEPPAVDAPPPPPTDLRLKDAYRALARRFHPDLASSEAERLRFSALMVRINDLYRDGDLTRLLALFSDSEERPEDDPAVEESTALAKLRERLQWLEGVRDNLADEHKTLENSATFGLWRRHQAALAANGDLIHELKGELEDKISRGTADIGIAIRELEAHVEHYNRAQTGLKTTKARANGGAELERAFDPQRPHRLVRLSLEALAQKRASAAARAEADAIEALAVGEPRVLRLLLFAFVADLAPAPLAGIEHLADLERRFAALGAADEVQVSLERTLLAAADRVAFGVRRATAKTAFSGLRLLPPVTREALPLALGRLRVRRELKRVLAVLGEERTCDACRHTGFTVPLFHIRGLDELRANVCPACGAALERYFMPKGKDLQAVLNTAYLDLELVSEWTLRLGRATVAMQLLPAQAETLTVAALKARLCADVLLRHRVEVKARDVSLWQTGAPVPERTALAQFETRTFNVRFARGTSTSVAEAVDLLKHRIRNRFRRDVT